MTRNDFQRIARAIAKARSTCSGDSCTASGALDEVASNLSDELAQTNPRFQRLRFLEATRA